MAGTVAPDESHAALPRGRRAPYSLFFAIFPPPGEAAQIAQYAAGVARDHRLQGRALSAHSLHVTLHDLGGYDVLPDDLVAAANAAGDAANGPGFEVVFDRAASFSSEAFVLYGSNGVEQLAAFRHGLGMAMRDAGMRPTSSFTPHMTLLYDRQRIAEHPIDPVLWSAREFALVKSHVGMGVHEILGRWPLRD
ncbi:MAG: 2'-5' RNA ligase family protein [Telluria sp.]